MQNEIRYYLEQIKVAMTNPQEGQEPYRPKYIITAAKLPTGAVELAVNTEEILSKIDYILEAYDENMHLLSNTDIIMQNIMIV